MTIASDIKKELNAYFKAQGKKIKFSVTTNRVSCSDEITVKWTGGAFRDEVWDVVKKYHTLVDKSDGMTDYFFRSGVDVVLKRYCDDQDIDFIQNVMAPVLSQSGYEFNFETWDGLTSVSVQCEGRWIYTHDSAYQMLDQYFDTGAIAEEIPSYKMPQPEKIEAPKPELLKGESVDESKTHIIIHWAEGVQIYETESKFGSFKSAHAAALNIYQQNKDCHDVCYIKLKFSIVYSDGEIYEGRLDMSPREDDPTKTDNIFKTHCMGYINWNIENNHIYGIDEAVYNTESVNIWLSQYGFDDKTIQDDELMQTKEELIEVMRQMKEYLDIQIELLQSSDFSNKQERLKSLDHEFGIELLKRRKQKLSEKLLNR